MTPPLGRPSARVPVVWRWQKRLDDLVSGPDRGQAAEDAGPHWLGPRVSSHEAARALSVKAHEGEDVRGVVLRIEIAEEPRERTRCGERNGARPFALTHAADTPCREAGEALLIKANRLGDGPRKPGATADLLVGVFAAIAAANAYRQDDAGR